MQTYLKELRWGLFNLIFNDMISAIAAHYGEWSEVEVVAFQWLLQAESHVIEVGANIGLHSVPLAKFIPNGKLICFEPQRIIFQQLCCNLSLNNLTNVESYRMGVGANAGKQWIETSDYSQPWNYGSFSLDKGFSAESDFMGAVQKEEIEIICLDDFAPVARLESLSLLKIDAEGLDVAVLQGAQKTIARLQPIIFVEVHQDSFQATLAELQRQNYQAYWLVSTRYQPNNFFGNHRIEKGMDANLLCLPTACDQAGLRHPIFDLLAKATSFEQLLTEDAPFMTMRTH